MFGITNDPTVTRLVSTDVLAQQPQLLDAYPHRYVLVISPGHLSQVTLMVAQLFWAVEMLESRGWELTGWKDAGDTYGAFMRRRAGAPAGGPPP